MRLAVYTPPLLDSTQFLLFNCLHLQEYNITHTTATSQSAFETRKVYKTICLSFLHSNNEPEL
jgi:hypothetical protein